MQYGVSLPFSGKPDKAFSLAESTLTSIGFRLTTRTPESLEAVGPGMNSSQQSALVGASRIRFRGDRGHLAVEAELGGVQWLSQFVMLFPPSLCLFLAIVLSTVFGIVFGPGAWILIVAGVTGGIAAVWLIVGPLIARAIRARTCHALDALLANMVAVGGWAEPNAPADGGRDPGFLGHDGV